MQLKFDQLMSRLESSRTGSDRLPAVVWVHGEEALLLLEACDAVRSLARATGTSERKVFEVDRSFKIEHLQTELSSLSLFAEARLIELRLGAKPVKELAEVLAQEVSRLDETTRLLITSPYLDKSTTESAWFKKIDSLAWTCAVFAIERSNLPEWIMQRLGRQKQRVSHEAVQWLADRLEGNLLAAKQELMKLSLLFPPGEIGLEHLQATVLSVSRFDSFDLVAAALAGDATRCLRLLKGLEAEGEATVLVLNALGNCARDLNAASELASQRQPIDMALRGVFWKTRPLYEQALRRLKPAQIQRALLLASQADTIVKGIAASTLPHLAHKDAWSSLADLTMAFCGQQEILEVL